MTPTPTCTPTPELPVVFVFDEPLLRRLRRSGERPVCLAETLAGLATRRDLDLHRGSPADARKARNPAVTFAPVPGFARLTQAGPVEVAALHPWTWLAEPDPGSLTSLSA